MKKLKYILLIMLILGTISGCSSKESAKDKQSEIDAPKYTFNIYDVDYEVTYEKAPQRAVTLSQFMTEMLLALGLEDRMVGTAFMDNDIYSEYEEAYNKIPVLSDKYPSKEALFDVEPDFVSGWASAFNEKRVASVDEYLSIGAKPFLAESITPNGSLETVYSDFMRLGKIFRVEENATTLVNEMKNDVEDTIKKLDSIKATAELKVLAYDSGTDEPFVVAGGGVSGDLIKKARGKNIFDDIEKGYATVSWEEIIDRDPDVIVVVNYGDTDYESKVNFLKENEALKDISAIKNNRFVKIDLSQLSPGIRNVEALRVLARGIYPDNF